MQLTQRSTSMQRRAISEKNAKRSSQILGIEYWNGLYFKRSCNSRAVWSGCKPSCCRFNFFCCLASGRIRILLNDRVLFAYYRQYPACLTSQQMPTLAICVSCPYKLLMLFEADEIQAQVSLYLYHMFVIVWCIILPVIYQPGHR